MGVLERIQVLGILGSSNVSDPAIREEAEAARAQQVTLLGQLVGRMIFARVEECWIWDDHTKEWTFPEGVQYVHGRLLCAEVTGEGIALEMEHVASPSATDPVRMRVFIDKIKSGFLYNPGHLEELLAVLDSLTAPQGLVRRELETAGFQSL